MKERIEELARECGMPSMANLDYRGSVENMPLLEKEVYWREMQFANAVLEMAAKECDKLANQSHDNLSDLCAEAIRKLKV